MLQIVKKPAWPVLLLVPFLSACAIGGRGGEFCLIAEPIYIDGEGDGLTPETARAVLQHNEVGARLCGWMPAE